MPKYIHLLEKLKPKHYDIHLELDEEELSLKGKVRILAQAKPAKSIKLHALDLKVSKAEVNGQKAKAEYGKELIELKLDKQVSGEVEIYIEYTGEISTDMTGVYRSQSDHGYIVSTQFESHHARQAFPCIDEPEAKATFKLTLLSNKPAISNTEIESTKEGKKIETVFKETPIMSTYLLAFVSGDIASKETKTKDGILVRTFATPDKVDGLEFSLDIAKKSLEYFQEFFGVKYPLSKCDNVAIPDFSAGAMENWGLITYRESSMLVDEHTPLAMKKGVALTVAHEIAHQWFGNLVTMRWWTDLWLNEGFASWVEYLALDHIFPEWKVWEDFVIQDYSSALGLDSLKNSHPVEVDINDPDEIRSIFDAISYSKGASVIRMLFNYIGEKDFRKGLQHYLKTHAYSNASTEDLWTSLDKVSQKPVREFMGVWTKQTGFPLLTVEKNKVSQSRFLLNPSRTRDLWPIPLEGKTFSEAKAHIKIRDYPNPGHNGFFVSKISEDVIGDMDIQKLGPIEQAGLIQDTWMNAKADSSCEYALDMQMKLKNTDSYIVWQNILGNTSELLYLLGEDSTKKAKKYMQELLSGPVEKLGWEEKANDTHFDTLLRPSLFYLSIKLDLFDAKEFAFNSIEVKSPEEIPANMRSAILAAVAREDSSYYKQYWKWYTEAKSAQMKLALTRGICSFRDKDIIPEILDNIKGEDIRLQDTPYWLSSLLSNTKSKDLAWQWMQDNWNWVEDNFRRDLITYSRMPLYAASGMKSQQRLDEYKAFFKGKGKSMARQTKQGEELIIWHIRWAGLKDQLDPYFSSFTGA